MRNVIVHELTYCAPSTGRTEDALNGEGSHLFTDRLFKSLTCSCIPPVSRSVSSNYIVTLLCPDGNPLFPAFIRNSACLPTMTKSPPCPKSLLRNPTGCQLISVTERHFVRRRSQFRELVTPFEKIWMRTQVVGACVFHRNHHTCNLTSENPARWPPSHTLLGEIVIGGG